MAKNAHFEESLKKLEKIVTEMEGSELDLDKSLAMFEEGVKLAHFCSAKLEETKKKVEILVKKGDIVTKAPFNPDENEGNGKDLFE